MEPTQCEDIKVWKHTCTYKYNIGSSFAMASVTDDW